MLTTIFNFTKAFFYNAVPVSLRLCILRRNKRRPCNHQPQSIALPSRKNIIIICSRLDLPGGIERAVCNTANLFQSNGHGVTLLVLDETANAFYPLEQEITLLHHNINFGIGKFGNVLSRKLSFFKDIKKLKAVLNLIKPDAVISTEYPFTIATYLAVGKASVPVYAWEHHHFHHLPKSRFWNFLFKRIYPKLSSVICLNPDEARLFGSIGCRTVVIPNFTQRGNKALLDKKNFLTIGWLSKTKGVDQIPEIAKEVFAKHPDRQWKIIGSGEERKWLLNELKKKGLDANVSVIEPSTNNLEGDYLSASVYVSTSRFECFPMVLLEAMSHGLPCIAFDCPTGPRFIINNGSDGLLIEPGNVGAMAIALINLMKDEEKRQALGNAAYQNIGRFSPDKIFALWESHVLDPIAKD